MLAAEPAAMFHPCGEVAVRDDHDLRGVKAEAAGAVGTIVVVGAREFVIEALCEFVEARRLRRIAAKFHDEPMTAAPTRGIRENRADGKIRDRRPNRIRGAPDRVFYLGAAQMLAEGGKEVGCPAGN